MKIGRNAPCLCGSGKKYKKCCIENIDNKLDSFEENIYQIRRILTEYSLEDCLISIYAIAAWLPNISSMVKCDLLYKILLGTRENSFRSEKEIRNYKDFSVFTEEIFGYLPSFPMMEDFLPIQDDGEIKYYFEEEIFKVFYATGFEDSYEYLYAFEMLFLPFEKVIYNLTGRSMVQEFRSVLRMQDGTISKIKGNKRKDDISLGYIELPEEEFWLNVVEYITSFDVSNFESSWVEKNLIELKNATNYLLKEAEFIDMFYYNKGVYQFVKSKERYYPVFLRDSVIHLYNDWGSVFSAHKDNSKFNSRFEIQNASLGHFASSRFGDKIIPIISTINDNDLDELVYSFGFVSGKQMHFIYLLDPLVSEKDEEIILTCSKIDQTIASFKTNREIFSYALGMKLALHEAVDDLEPKAIIVVPSMMIGIESLGFRKKSNCEVIFLKDFLYILDEIKVLEEFSDFQSFLNTNNLITPFSSISDRFAAFKGSNGVLVEGSLNPNFVMLESHFSADYRFDSLKEFWSLFPQRPYYGHPREWHTNESNTGFVRLSSKVSSEVTYYKQIRDVQLFIGSNMENDFDISNFTFSIIIESICYNINKYMSVLERFSIFNQNKDLVIKIYPKTIVISDKKYSHVKELIQDGEFYNSDFMLTEFGFYGIRFVFDDQMLQSEFIAVTDKSLENSLFLNFVNIFSKEKDRETYQELVQEVKKSDGEKPGFRLDEFKLDYSFGSFIRTVLPEDGDFKKVRNRISELVQQEGIEHAVYKDRSSLAVINKIIKLITNDIESTISRYQFTSEAIIYILDQLDMLIHNNNCMRMRIQKSNEMEIEYDPIIDLKEEEERFLLNHRNIRYIIEVFNTIRPSGEKKIDDNSFRYLIALVDWMYSLRQMSDSLHYGLDIAGEIEITEEHLVNTTLPQQVQDNMNYFGEIRAGKVLDQERSFNFFDVCDIDEYVDSLDEVFEEVLGFKFKDMLLVLDVLAHWGNYMDVEQYNFCHMISENLLSKTIYEKENLEESTVSRILNYLMLDQNLTKTSIAENHGRLEHDILPIWEYYKRDHRYAIRPLIRLGKDIIWGVCSAKKARDIWLRAISHFETPYDFNDKRLMGVLDVYLKKVQDYLVSVAFDIVNSKEVDTYKEAELYKIDKKGNHPRDLGDYDLLVFNKKINTIISVECKFFKRSYCLKDAKRDMEKTFFGQGKKKSYISKVEKRHKYLEENKKNIIQNLNKDFNLSKPVTVKSVFVTIDSTYWTMFPPIETNIEFCDILELRQIFES